MRELSCMEASQLGAQAVLANVPSAAWLTTVSRQSFVVDGDVAAAAAALRGAVRDLQASPAKYNSWTELRGDGRDFTLLAVTAIGWLDPTRITLAPEPSDGGRTRVRMVGWSAGLLPLTIPAAPLLNLCLFFVPFAGVSWLRTSKLKKAMLAQASAPGDVGPSPLS